MTRALSLLLVLTTGCLAGSERDTNLVVRELGEDPGGCTGEGCSTQPQGSCAVDTDCADPLGQTCAAGRCVPNPCDLHPFTFDAGGATHATVHVAGSFNGWPATIADGGLAMTRDPHSGLWFAKRSLGDGVHLYKYVLDESEWIADPANPDSEEDGFGGRNSRLTMSCAGGGGGSLACDPADFDWRDAVLYFVMTDRFYDSDGQADPVPDATGGDARWGASGQYEGGDIAGITAKLPYLADLGVTALWITAPYENRNWAGAAISPGSDPHLYSAYHGYWPSPDAIDFGDPRNPVPRPAVESRIGSEDDLRALVTTAHATAGADGHGIKVLADYVMNHVDVSSGLYAAHPDWFATDNGRFRLCGPENLWDDPTWGTRCAFTDYLPPFDFTNDAARAWSVADAVWWARELGFDGYRLDAIKHVPQVWLTDLRQQLDAAITDPAGGRFYLVGETFSYDDRELLKSFVDPATKLDGQFDFPFKARVCEAVLSRQMPLSDFAGWMAGNDGFYGSSSIMTSWIGNHDVPRPIHFASGQIGNCREGSHAGNSWSGGFDQPTDAAPYERLALAFAVMMTNPGIPLIYYGDEIGLAGGGDPDNRRTMVWNDAELNAHQLALRSRVADLAHLRATHKVLSRGHRETLHADSDAWVYRMTGCDETIVVAINRGDWETSVEVPAGTYTDLLDGGNDEGGWASVPARGVRILAAD